MSGKVYEARKQGWLGVTLTQGEVKALVANEETTRFTRGLSSLFSLLLKSFFLFLYMVALTLFVSLYV